MEGNNKPIFTTAAESLSTVTTESYVSEVQAPTNMDAMFTPLAPSYRARETSELMNLMHREPKPADIAPAGLHIDSEMLVNFRNSGSESIYEDVDHGINSHYYMNSRPESSSSSVWAEEPSTSSSASARNEEMIETFDFLAKSLTSANNFVSMLTRDQLALLRGFKPSLLYEFLQETVKLRGDKRLRRAGPNECAFCKNNGENEECYSSHALKDWRGRVLCPVLRAFRCPRCGATGDRAHTIKYCPEQADSSHAGLERAGSFTRRRMGSPASLVFGQQPATSPPPAPASLGHSSLWNFNIN